MTGAELVSAGLSLLDRSDPGLGPTWVRSASLLGRQALEQSLDSFWSSRSVALEDVSMKAQLACLPDYVGTEKAGHVAELWGRLSEACHHRVVDTGPTGAEVREWLTGVDDLMGWRTECGAETSKLE